MLYANILTNPSYRISARIYIIDSLNHPRDRVKTVLTSYLTKEAVYRGKLKDEKDAREPAFIQAKVDPLLSNLLSLSSHVFRHGYSYIIKAPEQPNYCDCGIYLIHFARIFINHPDRTEVLMRVRWLRGPSKTEANSPFILFHFSPSDPD